MPETTELMTNKEDAIEEAPNKKVKLSSEDVGEVQNADVVNSELLLEKKQRIKKRKHAILLGYLGKGYFGMQVNKDMSTIESELFKAFKEAGVMDEEAIRIPQSVQYQRAARTDKGVSASKQVVSLKMDPIVDEKETVKKLCEVLPNQIRVFAVKRVTNGYNSKLSCDFRSYAYTMPTFAFTPLEEQVKEDFRVTKEILEEVNKTMSIFKGTHRFHNFTARRKPTDPSCKRYIMEFRAGEPFVREGIEFVTIHVKGQSFMLHQIRKMIGTVIAISRGMAAGVLIEKAWNQDRVDIPIAPALGLILEEPHYENYNKRYGSDGMHEALDWKECEAEVKNFFDTYILPSVVEGEVKEKSMMKWLSTLINHSFEAREEGENNPKSPFIKAAMNIEEDEGAKSD